MTHPRLRELVLLGGAALIFAVALAQLGDDIAVPFLGFLAAFGAMHIGVRAWAPRADPLLLPLAALLFAVGAMQLASIDRLQTDVSSTWRALAPLQTGWLIFGGAGFLGTVILFRNGLGPAWRVRYTLALLGLVALIAPLLPGIGHTVNGARLWLRIGPLSFQPVEATKVLLVLFLAAYLSERRELLGMSTRRIGPLLAPEPRYLAPLLGIIGLAILVFVRQNDLGSSLLFFLTFMAILWIGTGRAYYPALGIILFAVAVWIALQTFEHVGLRFEAWLHPFNDPQRSGYQILQGQYALAEGGVAGMGLVGPDTQPHLIPFGWTDLILASVGHTLGLAGILAVVMGYVVLLTRSFFVALRSRSDLHALAAAGFGIVLGVQAALIAGGVTRVLPLTGVTLPFVSYGGSSLLSNFVILGCLVAISHSEATTEARELEEAAV
ncbi:MAG TPA: FtsW/RodA/SpoVE family cell cycle protein [Actinomycetota bacterium]|jgi:peptidoglycan glycosyltransferase|nr:FtsW/RodA/SpoVE family cell cycle protein [Actinomycetota bacterium]